MRRPPGAPRASVDSMLQSRNMPTPDEYRRWFTYEKESHASTLASIDTIPDGDTAPAARDRALALLAHMARARQVWLFRLGSYPEPPKEFFPTGLSKESVAQELDRIEAAWDTFLTGLDAAEVQRIAEYGALDGGRFRTSVDDILTQLHGHSLYHRGQIAATVKAAGGTPARTDFVLWAREKVG